MEDICAREGLSRRIEIDSCGTGGWHAGEAADPRSAQCGSKYGLDVTHTARQLTAEDFDYFDLILVMDRANLRDVRAVNPGCGKVVMLRSFDKSLEHANELELEVPDPYYGGEQGFELMYQMLKRACDGLLARLRQRI